MTFCCWKNISVLDVCIIFECLSWAKGSLSQIRRKTCRDEQLSILLQSVTGASTESECIHHGGNTRNAVLDHAELRWAC